MRAYYNENDPYAAQWLRNLIAAGHIAPGEVDERSIIDVRAIDLVGYSQCHFFAGIGGWSHALRLAGWPDTRAVWTGSCPCQPLSVAGQQRGHADERHLWPAFHALIAQCRPATVFGEQVASKDGHEWLAGVRADLEGTGYACGAADLSAAGAGAPHIRQRLFWVADRDGGRQPQLEECNGRAHTGIEPSQRHDAVGCGATGGLADADRLCGCGYSFPAKLGKYGCPNCEGEQSGRLGDAEGSRLAIGERDGRDACEVVGTSTGQGPQAGVVGFWDAYDLVPCSDGKTRRTGPGIFPLADRATARVGRLRAYGNCIVPPLAAEFIAAFMDL